MAILHTQTAYGAVSGKRGENREISVFLGIPFAKPPIGELRYQAPREPEVWEGERACVDFGPSCIQGFHPDKRWDTEISEDCLYLNVYTPADNADEKLPVMFWIYGGGFTGGSSADPEMSGEHLAQKGVVVVTINYRCGAMGFLALPEIEKKNGRVVNAGLLDQIAALRWVNSNIEAFGGDPERILVFGQSSGGISTRMLLTSPLSRGLFSRAIIESGGGLNEADPIRPKQEFISLCQRAMEHLGWNYEDMMTLDAMEINEKMIQAARETVVTDEVGYFQPFIDEYSITEVPGKLISKGEYMDIPIICGTVAGDSWMFSRKVRDQLKERNYFRGFSYASSQAWARLQTEKDGTPIYTFYMDRKQPPREMKGFRRGAPPYGADTPHGTEVAYVFGTLNVRNQPYSPLDYEMSDVIGDYWTNFAKYGNPNGEGIAQWPRYTEETPYAMHFGNDGWKAENIVLSKEEEETLAYTKEHPGLLTSFESNIPRQPGGASMPPMGFDGRPPEGMPPMGFDGRPPEGMPPMGFDGRPPEGMPPMGFDDGLPEGMPPMGFDGGLPGRKPHFGLGGFKPPMADISWVKRKYLDVSYGESKSQAIDIYLPDEGEGPFPVIIHIHGGGFEMGDKRDDHMDAYLDGIRRGYAVASIEYRLSREAKFPAAVLDVREAIRFLKENAAEYHIDSERIGLIGGSAGSNLCAMLAMNIPNGEFPGEDITKIRQAEPYVKTAVCQFGPMNFATMEEQAKANGISKTHPDPSTMAESKYLGVNIPDADPKLVASANPATYAGKNMCPVLVQHGTADQLVPFEQSLEFVDNVIAKAGADKVTFVPVEGARHEDKKFVSEPNMSLVWEYYQKYL